MVAAMNRIQQTAATFIVVALGLTVVALAMRDVMISAISILFAAAAVVLTYLPGGDQ
jgi:hypothetical protein